MTRAPANQAPIARPPNYQLPTADQIAEAKALLEGTGHVVLREGSYRRAQERQAQAENRARYAEELREGTERWAQQDLCPDNRRLRERITFVYGVARAHSATVEELGGTSVLDSTGDEVKAAIAKLLRDAAVDGNWTVGKLADGCRTIVNSTTG